MSGLKPGRDALLKPVEEFNMRLMREAGMTIRQCETYFNVSRATVYRTLAKQRAKFGPEKLPRRQSARANVGRRTIQVVE